MKTNRKLNIEELKDLVEGGSVAFKTNSRSYIFTCPMCDKDKLYVERTTGRSKCFRCEWSGWADFTLSRVYKRTLDDLSVLLYGSLIEGTGWEPREVVWRNFWGQDEDEVVEDGIEYPPELVADPEWVPIESVAGAKGAAYLAHRGIPPSLATEYGVQYHRAEQRVIFPAYVDGKLRGWQGRYIGQTEGFDPASGKTVRIPKAKTTGKIGGALLMWQDRLKGCEHAVLGEGPFDGLKCHFVGGNVISLGKDVSQQQIRILIQSGIKKLYIGLDRDAGKDVERVARNVKDHMEVYRLLPPDHRDDLGECDFEEVIFQFEHAPRYRLGMPTMYFPK